MTGGRAAGALAVLSVAVLGLLPAPNVLAGPVARRAGLDEQQVRIALAIGVRQARITGTAAWGVYEADGVTAIADGAEYEAWRFEHDGRRIRGVRPDGGGTEYLPGPLIIRPAASAGFLVHAGVRYRGEILVHASESGLTVVNRLPIDDYLKGVVPVEIGNTRTMAEFAAAEAQAVAARSYAYVRLGADADRRWYDLRPTVADQAYGGANAETVVGTRAVESTAGLVLKYDGRVVNTPYHSTCGGLTAEAPEAWATGDEPFLRRVSDQVPGTDRFFCDISPRFRWTRELSADRLDAAVARYLGEYASVSADGPGPVRAVAVSGRTPSGRVAAVEILTATGGRYALRGNDARFVLRAPNGAILNSAHFDIAVGHTGTGRLSHVVLRGAGYGHGVGMCQWGAIGRARAGQDYRTILATYFPGTVVEPIL